MPSDYPDKIVLMGYFFQEGQPGSKNDRGQFSQELYDRYDQHIINACAPVVPALNPSPEERAIMAVIATHATGNSTEQAQHAVEAYVIFRGL